MIVNIAGWLFIIGAALAPLSLAIDTPHGSLATKLVAIFSAVLWGSVGIGLLKRKNWARWLSLGVSLLTWTLGSLALLFMLPGVLRVVFAPSGGMFAALLLFLMICAAIFAAMIVINFKLFHYLTSEEGKFEFDTPESESHAILKSTGVYIVLVIVAVMAEQPERNRLERRSAATELAMRDHAARRESEAREARAAQERTNEATRRADQRLLDADSPSAVGRAVVNEVDTRTYERSEPVETREPETNQILKCRDASGAISYTQGYCPAGTQRVEIPRPD